MSTDVRSLETPCVLVNFDIAEANIDRFQAYCNEHGITSRPHIKTHKLPVIAKRQATAGGVGITCQKVSEAEVMADAGVSNIFITYNIIGETKVRKLRALSERCTISVVADNEVVVRGLSKGFADAANPLEVLIECDTGASRCGVQSTEEATELAKFIDASPGLKFSGLMTYPPTLKPEVQHNAEIRLSEAKLKIEAEGLVCERISSGGTPNMWRAHEAPVVTEHRAGTYVYNDRWLLNMGHCEVKDCALTVLATVISHPTEDRAIIDAGSKTLTSDLLGLEGHGLIVNAPDAKITQLNEEHGFIDLSGTDWRPDIGDKIRIIPNHCCVVSNTSDTIWVLRGDKVIGEEKVAARGKVI
ncbi:MAG: D-TA family PLP-dependent enzyme [Rhodospirillales bacterium]|nr:D-TA family PLP-dependent enzyme [Rhodospirillales bacterium]